MSMVDTQDTNVQLARDDLTVIMTMAAWLRFNKTHQSWKTSFLLGSGSSERLYYPRNVAMSSVAGNSPLVNCASPRTVCG